MKNKQMKCIKGESCLHCGSNYCRFVDEINQLKAENEKLVAELANSVFDSFEELDKLKAENEEWKKEIINRNEKIEELRFSVSDLTNRLCDLNAEKSFRIVDLEQTLTEIKEIAEGRSNYPCSKCIKTEILQKISEVIPA